MLNISAAQVYALVRSGELPAIKIGGRGQWRVEASELEGYIARMYDQTREFVDHPPVRAPSAEDDRRARTPTDDGLDAGAETAGQATAADQGQRAERDGADRPDRAPAARLARRRARLTSTKSAPTRSTVPLTTLPSVSQTWTGSRSRAIPRSAEPSPSRANT